MTTLSHTCNSLGCEVKLPRGFGNKGLCLDHYLTEAIERLDAAAECFRIGEGFDNQTLAWLLAQVDFVMETMSDESMLLREEQRSKLMEVLLGIANLYQHVHQYSAVVQPTH